MILCRKDEDKVNLKLPKRIIKERIDKIIYLFILKIKNPELLRGCTLSFPWPVRASTFKIQAGLLAGSSSYLPYLPTLNF
jgi:hypothetical protein